MACILMEQLDHLLVSPDYPARHRPAVKTSTFEGALPEIFDSLCRPAHEILVLFKSIVTALGDPQEPDKVTVSTTIADHTKWPRSTVMVLRLATNFILTQIRIRRVVLVQRNEDCFLGSIFASKDGMDYSGIVAGCREGAEPHSLPETFVDTVDCLFNGPVNNHIVSITQTCMQLAGNQPLPRFRAGGLAVNPSGASRGQHTVEGPAGGQDSDSSFDASCHTAAESVAILAGVGAQVPVQEQASPISMFPLHISCLIMLTQAPRWRLRREHLA
ncbi:hypothetical protein KVR01_003375 [Diaporthe batatas]|uniref:uncharacterized protein n=1 Tax=Diaporthe batatas TaxID=748121 RepID=UPI001D05253B|nr:uncharacterized protein KVR01_003375 [Diaporthe batatas]KAG8167686.1 hypothetical protein KVR01_003375 [Diaporthe batatas]